VNGDFVEINADEDGFDDVRLRLADHLPLPSNWYEQIESLPMRECLTFFDRRGQTQSN
jgi:hypothetical protein